LVLRAMKKKKSRLVGEVSVYVLVCVKPSDLISASTPG
jgi:hypothetical protein